MKIHDKLASYGYGVFNSDDQIELLLNSANIRDVKKRMKLIKENHIQLYDLFAGNDKAKLIMSQAELDKIKAIRLLVASYFEEGLQRRQDIMSEPSSVAEYLRAQGQDNIFESFKVLYLTPKNSLLKCETMDEGTTDSAVVYPRKICKRALELNASLVIVSHNHPSGICDPSNDDIRLTNAVRNALDTLDIKLLDHIIIGHRQGYFSFRERGLLDGYTSGREQNAAEAKGEYRNTETKAQSLLNKVDRKLDEMYQKIDSPETEKELREYLKFMSKFYNYSMGNQLLIMFESMCRGTNIEAVGSYKFWSEIKNGQGTASYVKKGEKGYPVLVPVEYIVYEKAEDGTMKAKIDPETGKEVKKLAFKSGAVFDVNQTTAAEIGAFKTLAYRASGESISEATLMEMVAAIEKKYNVAVRMENVEGTARGYYSWTKNQIVVDNKPDRTNDMKLSTLFHELGHHVLHGEELRARNCQYSDIHNSRGAREGEAEAFSYALSSMFGIENKSELYIKQWGNSAKELKERLSKVRGAVREVIGALELGKASQINENRAQDETKKTITLHPIENMGAEREEETAISM